MIKKENYGTYKTKKGSTLKMLRKYKIWRYLLKNYIFINVNLPGQGESQGFFCTFCPGQDLRGEEQIRPRCLKPRPHDTEQADQLDQSDQPPDTEIGKNRFIVTISANKDWEI